MSQFAVSLILTTFVSSGAFGHPMFDRWSQIPPDTKLSDYMVQYEIYISEYNKTYTLAEILQRLPIFIAGSLRIDELNAEEPAGGAKYGQNHFTDWTRQERANMTSMKHMMNAMPEVDFVLPVNVQAPSRFDWRDTNKVTPVKNQGQCGSCWAFSTVAQIENHYAIKKGSQKSFSEQQLVDCDKKSSGCNGGWMDSAIASIKDKGGLDTAASYPYEGRQGSCRFRSNYVGTKVKDNIKLRSNDENGMANYIATTSSTINAINADRLQYYKSGVMKGSGCKKEVNHAVNVVGYTQDYWIAKNSWGTGWGEKGFFRIERGNNACGISTYVYAATVM